jgi:addiction module HigA family antidote
MGERAVTADTALRLARYLGDAQFWLNLQTAYDLREAERKTGKEITKAVRLRAA